METSALSWGAGWDRGWKSALEAAAKMIEDEANRLSDDPLGCEERNQHETVIPDGMDFAVEMIRALLKDGR